MPIFIIFLVSRWKINKQIKLNLRNRVKERFIKLCNVLREKGRLSPGTSKIRLNNAMKDTIRQWNFVTKETFLV